MPDRTPHQRNKPGLLGRAGTVGDDRPLILRDRPTNLHEQRVLVSTVHERGWSTLADGALLAAAEQDGFAVFVTTDQQRKYQRQLAGRRLAILVLGTTSWPRIEPHAKAIRQLIADLVAGAYREFPLLRPTSSNERPERGVER